jgi:Tol biopolymer transport system component
MPPNKVIVTLVQFALILSSLLASGQAHADGSFDVSPDGQQIVFSATDGNLYLLYLETSRVVQLTQTKSEGMPSFSPDGKSIVYVGTSKGGTHQCVFTRSLDGRQSRQLTTGNVHDSSPSYSPGGSEIVFARADRHRRYSMGGWTWDDWDVYIMKADGTQVRRITGQKYYNLSTPWFSGGGKSVVYAAFADRRQHDLCPVLFEVDCAGNRPPLLLSRDRDTSVRCGAWASEPRLSNDGEHIVFISDRLTSYHYDVMVMDRDGSHPRPLGVTSVSRYNCAPAFLPDGKEIIFLARTRESFSGDAIFSLWQVDVTGNNPRLIADSDLFTKPLRWKRKP